MPSSNSKKDAQSGMPGVFDRMPEIQSALRDLQTKNLRFLRGETGQIVSQRLARHALVLSDVSHRNSRAYDRRKK